MKLRVRVFRRELAHIVGNMEIQRVLAIARYLYVHGIGAKGLNSCREFIWHLRLIFAHKHKHLERVACKNLQILGLHIFKIDKYVIHRQKISGLSCCPNV